ncbi:hypothetical protein H8356DRAFT_1431225 [Neocallimastix lanati (nom. inval.)]|nr:hypothetical protein H8356DRAFT_1431225 [Neocallimastix sp. JGI-2020a]
MFSLVILFIYVDIMQMLAKYHWFTVWLNDALSFSLFHILIIEIISASKGIVKFFTNAMSIGITNFYTKISLYTIVPTTKRVDVEMIRQRRNSNTDLNDNIVLLGSSNDNLGNTN